MDEIPDLTGFVSRRVKREEPLRVGADQRTDHVAMGLALAGVSIPNFVLGPVLVLALSLTVYLLPPALWQGPASRVLPVLTAPMRPVR